MEMATVPKALEQDQETSTARFSRLVACRAGLAILPVALALSFYFAGELRYGASRPLEDSDAGFYAYQLSRVGELGGRWWKLGTDENVGQPFRTGAAKHPGVYEGVDLLIVSTLTSRSLGPEANYHAMCLLVLALNGWVAAWMVYHLTRSHAFAALGVILITLNMSTSMQMSIGHLHLIKHYLYLLSIWAFFRYLDSPTPGRSALFGLSWAMELQGSFYYGFYVLLATSIYWIGCLVGRRIGRQHVKGALVAAVVAGAVGLAMTFPVWTMSRKDPLSGDYFRRSFSELWFGGTFLSHYFLSPLTKFGWDNVMVKTSVWWECWHYPGTTVLLALAGFAIGRPARWPMGAFDPRLLDRLLIMTGILVVLSLTGGPSDFIFPLAPSFRIYGRCGFLAVGLLCVATPAIFQGLINRMQPGPLRGAFFAVLIFLALVDGLTARRWFEYYPPYGPPSWVAWLAKQPADCRIAAFPLIHDERTVRKTKIWSRFPAPYGIQEVDDWEWSSLYYSLLHRHRTLNGCEFSSLRAALRQHGATYEKMNESGLRMIASYGYNTFAFHRGYLEWNPWIQKLPWLERIDQLDDWSLYRVNPLAAGSKSANRSMAPSADFSGSDGWVSPRGGAGLLATERRAEPRARRSRDHT
jgi:hypothetical protein